MTSLRATGLEDEIELVVWELRFRRSCVEVCGKHRVMTVVVFEDDVLRLICGYVGRFARMSVSEYRGRRFEPWYLYVVSLSKRLYPHCFSRVSCEMSTRWDNLVKDVQCNELFGGIALKNHAFFFSMLRKVEDVWKKNSLYDELNVEWGVHSIDDFVMC